MVRFYQTINLHTLHTSLSFFLFSVRSELINEPTDRMMKKRSRFTFLSLTGHTTIWISGTGIHSILTNIHTRVIMPITHVVAVVVIVIVIIVITRITAIARNTSTRCPSIIIQTSITWIILHMSTIIHFEYSIFDGLLALAINNVASFLIIGRNITGVISEYSLVNQ